MKPLSAKSEAILHRFCEAVRLDKTSYPSARSALTNHIATLEETLRVLMSVQKLVGRRTQTLRTRLLRKGKIVVQKKWEVDLRVVALEDIGKEIVKAIDDDWDVVASIEVPRRLVTDEVFYQLFLKRERKDETKRKT